MMDTSYRRNSSEVLQKVDIFLDHDKADQDVLPDEDVSDVHDSGNVSVTFSMMDKDCTVSTRENSYLNQKIHAVKTKLKKTNITRIVKAKEQSTGNPFKRVRFDCDDQVQTLQVTLQTPAAFQKCPFTR